MDEQITNGAAAGAPDTALASEPTAETVEAQPVEAQPVEPAADRPRDPATRRTRLRWGIAAAVCLVAVIVSGAGAWVLSGAAGERSLTSSVAPQNTVFFMEIRSDLPGNQRSKMADFMTHFPGFADRAQFDNRWDTLLNQLTLRFSPELAYTSAFKPWMEGEFSIAIQDPATALAAGGGTCVPLTDLARVGTSDIAPSAEIIFALKDRAKAEAFIAAEVKRLGVPVTTESFAGTTLYVMGGPGERGAYAFTDRDLILGTVDGVKATLATQHGKALADTANYKSAMAEVTGDVLARYYVDVKSLMASSMAAYEQLMCAIPGGAAASLPPMTDGSTPAWLAGSIIAEADRIVVESKIPRPVGATATSHASRLASSLPGTTVAFAETHGIGASLSSGIGAIESAAPSMGIDSGTLDSLHRVLNLVGGVDWIGDGVVAVTKGAAGFSGGIVLEAPDAATAKARLGTITSLVGLSGLATGIKTRTETYAGSSITIITIPASIAGSELQVAAATRDNLVAVGYDEAFVKAMLDTTVANSLASKANYKAAIGAAGSSNQAALFVSVPGLKTEIASVVDTFDIVHAWALDYKPYLDHIDGLAVAVIDGATVTIRLIVTAS
jgi:hypothetical protein